MRQKMQAYSIDLRKKVISFIEEGNSQLLATKLFKLNKATVNRWWLRYKTEDHVNPRKNLGSKPRIDSLLLKDYLDNNADFNLSDISKLFNVSKVSAYKHLKKLGYSYKKKPSPMWKQIKKNEISTKKQ